MSQIIRDITEIARCGSQYRADRLAPMGLKACHASYLTEICDCPGISQEKLAGRICINKSNVARQAAVLEEEGFITRTPSPADKRVLQLYPTEKALSIMDEVRGILVCWEDCIGHDLSEEEKELLSGLLAKMKVRAAAYMEDR
ncbi:MAG: winged helix-turn-helix transcriptional regulator [Oscillospiraceae bacterium]|nr:winged helix-turn-helix transcriptional regulator [Oscillospiraceae bacterium]